MSFIKKAEKSYKCLKIFDFLNHPMHTKFKKKKNIFFLYPSQISVIVSLNLYVVFANSKSNYI